MTALSLGLRWVVLIAATMLAFAHTVGAAAVAVREGYELSYVPVVVSYAGFAAIAVRRRNRPVVEIHDRETDFIVAAIGVVFSLVAASLLAPTISGGARMWRIDLLMMWVFAVSGATVLFGLRRVFQYRWAWLTLILIWPLPVRLLMFGLGHGSFRWIAGLHLAVIVALLIIGRRPGERLWWLAPAAALLVAAPLVGLDIDRSPRLAVVAPLVAIVAGGLCWLLRDEWDWRGLRKPVVSRPLPAMAGLMVAAVIGYVVVPPLPPLRQLPELPVRSSADGPGTVVPAGWTLLNKTSYPGQSAYFGVHATWYRYRIQARDAAAGPGAVDGVGRKRQMVIDELTTERPRTFDLFGLQTTYPIGDFELTPAVNVDLGHGVRGELHAAVDPRARLTWSMVTFSFTLPSAAVAGTASGGPAQVGQRITLLLVDDHRPTAPFPRPTRAMLDSLRAVLTAVLRRSGDVRPPPIKNADLLVSAAQRIVNQRVEGAS
ncbi:hypothetical protein FOE78_07090 [Microlunatus elymi]|uniref:Polyketide cyclase / dehydrase and lipid transport n=1 Tax=Microlunatus elymi TaxID=2596828 RepID=A0A516PX00_9ACTN|nr:hypothetical protein [Microlunatus elymi]QDP95703.1 hypothetical protein FOE78_07090 [Microlunatus elymi]